MKSVSILGATGSVGRNTVDVIMAQPDLYKVELVTAHTQVTELADIAKRLNAARAVIADKSLYSELKDLLADTDIECAAGEAALIEAASIPVDWTMAAIVGMAGLPPLMAAIQRGGIIAIANKEPLVAAGPFVMEAARVSGATLLPVDSEHNAIFQVFDPDNRKAIERIILTASGGPFRTTKLEELPNVSREQALAHPTWSMGHKISIDSATMMNKALEVIEAHVLFDMSPEKIEVLIHPESVIHSMVEYSDGSILAQMGASDMRTPIAHTLGWPDRIKTPGQTLDFTAVKQLNFEAVDPARFPAVELAYQALQSGLPTCIAFNAANEVAVSSFLSHKISYPDIVTIVNQVMGQATNAKTPRNLDDVFALDVAMREAARSCIVSENQPVRKVS